MFGSSSGFLARITRESWAPKMKKKAKLVWIRNDMWGIPTGDIEKMATTTWYFYSKIID